MIDEGFKLIILLCAGALTISYPTIYAIRLIGNGVWKYKSDSEDENW